MYGFLGNLGFAALFGFTVKNDAYNCESVTKHSSYRHRILEYQNRDDNCHSTFCIPKNLERNMNMLNRRAAHLLKPRTYLLVE